MNTTGKKIILAAIGILSLAAFSMQSFGQHDHGDDHAAHEKKREAREEHGRNANPLIEEMVKLDAVFRDVVSGVAMGDGHGVHEALESMHGVMEKTHEGVHHGTVALKKNADRLHEFVEMDKAFHNKLEDLAYAAYKGNQKAMLSLTKELLDGCVKCHENFRK